MGDRAASQTLHTEGANIDTRHVFTRHSLLEGSLEKNARGWGLKGASFLLFFRVTRESNIRTQT